ncbi:MAG: LysE family translocator [Thermoleophilaceae bacterium]
MAESAFAFAGVAALLTISPGADMALVTRAALADGRGPAFATTLGICLGLVLWALASAVGLAALLSASATAFLVVKVAGATYLVALGVLALRRALRGGPAGGAGGVASAPARHPRRGSAFRQGLVSNLLNPKIAVFYTTVLPQFIAPGDPALAVSLVLVVIHVCLTLAWLSGYAYAVARAGEVLRRPIVRRALDALTGAVLVGLGVRLAFVQR